MNRSEKLMWRSVEKWENRQHVGGQRVATERDAMAAELDELRAGFAEQQHMLQQIATSLQIGAADQSTAPEVLMDRLSARLAEAMVTPMLRGALEVLAGGRNQEPPQLIAQRVLQDLPTTGKFVLHQGYRGVVLKGGRRWEDLDAAQFAAWTAAGYRTRTLYVDQAPADKPEPSPTSDALRIDWCVRVLEDVKAGGRKVLGDAYPEIVQVVGALKRVLEPGLTEGPDEVEQAPHQAPIPAETETPLKGYSARLTDIKTASIEKDRGYCKVGYVLVNDQGDVCISAQSAVRWLTKAHYWRLMHEQDGSLFSDPRPESSFNQVPVQR